MPPGREKQEKPQSSKRTIVKLKKFLVNLAETCSVTRSCKMAKLSRRWAYQLRADDQEFAEKWDKALDIGFDKLEEEAIRRAYKGYDKPVFQGGIQVGVVREYSDTLMCLLLKGRKRKVYGDKSEISGPNGGPIKIRQLTDFYAASEEQK